MAATTAAPVGMLADRQSFASESGAWNEPTTSREYPRGNPIAVSTYSFWRFKDDSKLSIERCIDEAARIGFDAVEILHVQMESEEAGYLQRLKRRAFINGMSLCGFSTHQGFLFPDSETRRKNIDHTIHTVELAYAMGIPTIRINTGRWGTS
jgi:sugar phosphate isomerase/epimerase